MQSLSLPNQGSKFLRLTIAIVLALAIFGASESTASAAGNDVVVFDIDGTLTNEAISVVPHFSAVKAVKTYLAKGYSVVYVTGRPQILELTTRAWLALNGFPSRPLYMAPGIYLDDGDLINYKTNVLASLEVGSPEVRHAYGDSSTDFVAYANAGVPQANVWALKRVLTPNCESGAWNACLSSYTGHLSHINSLPPGS